MDRITYRDATAGIKGTVIVYLAKKRIGLIVPRNGSWQYRSQGTTHWGAPFASLAARKASLEAA